jgi:hypothetical protein
MGIVCKQCGYENPEGTTICEICGESLAEMTPASQPEQPVQQVQPVSEPVKPQTDVDNGAEYFVLCPESQTKTILPNGNVTRYFCAGCQKEHEIDGILWMIEKKEKSSPNNTVLAATEVQSEATGDNLWLEEVNSHFRIDIDKEGGTLGRYGKYGAEFFQSRGLLMVSGEHCVITNEFGNWVIRHVSKTNQTMYNNMILGANEPNLLENGKTLTLANAVSFTVRIG